MHIATSNECISTSEQTVGERDRLSNFGLSARLHLIKGDLSFNKDSIRILFAVFVNFKIAFIMILRFWKKLELASIDLSRIIGDSLVP